jgi:hypothetical protein
MPYTRHNTWPDQANLEDEMQITLGWFLTEVGDVEHVMFETILAVATEDANIVHKQFYEKTFGPKFQMLESAVKHAAFDEHREGIDHLMKMLRNLIPQRNNIVHGETFYISRRDEFKAFRVGFTRRNTAPWKNFDFKGNAENIFTADQIEGVANDCKAIKTDLDLIRQKVILKLTGSRPPYLTHCFEID